MKALKGKTSFGFSLSVNILMKEPRHEKLNYGSDRNITSEEWGRVTGNMKMSHSDISQS